MAEMTKLISLSDIKCEEIVNMIEESTKIVLNFITCANYDLKDVQLEDPKILIERRCVNEFKDDGNTYTPGYEYNVYWCFRYINVSQRIRNVLYSESYLWPSYMLFFKFRVTERIEDHAYRGGNFFSLHITDEDDSKNSRIASYNDNYPLATMLVVNNIYKSVSFINSAYIRWKEKNKIKDHLKSIEIRDDIKDYISKITLK